MIAEYYLDYEYVTACKAVRSYWPGKVHDVVGITDDPKMLIFYCLNPVGVSVLCRLVPESFGLLSSVRQSGAFYGG